MRLRAKELYTKVIRNEEAATEFLRRYQLIDEPVEIAPCNKNVYTDHKIK